MSQSYLTSSLGMLFILKTRRTVTSYKEGAAAQHELNL